jgi:hypothetical protein
MYAENRVERRKTDWKSIEWDGIDSGWRHFVYTLLRYGSQKAEKVDALIRFWIETPQPE